MPVRSILARAWQVAFYPRSVVGLCSSFGEQQTRPWAHPWPGPRSLVKRRCLPAPRARSPGSSEAPDRASRGWIAALRPAVRVRRYACWQQRCGRRHPDAPDPARWHPVRPHPDPAFPCRLQAWEPHRTPPVTGSMRAAGPFWKRGAKPTRATRRPDVRRSRPGHYGTAFTGGFAHAIAAWSVAVAPGAYDPTIVTTVCTLSRLI